ncbi:MAG: histidine phosphotransferase family protein [Candidatus Kaistia colombiensis]|nr:MAG: histidine phosphotransferase family protein [Kaistia sp.]
MTHEIELEALDLAALLCSRVCHDIISPVGAINNGLEVLDEETSEEMKAFAFDLIRKSARQASAKLQFARLAFGAAGSAGAEIDIGDAEKVARGYMDGEKAEFSWTAPRALMPKNQVKLILNLVLMATAAVPRGGSIKVTVEGEPTKPDVTFHCSGPSARIPPAFEKLIPGTIVDVNIDAHAVQPYYAGLLARSCGMTVAAVLDGTDVIITARSSVAAPAVEAAPVDAPVVETPAAETMLADAPEAVAEAVVAETTGQA